MSNIFFSQITAAAAEAYQVVASAMRGGFDGASPVDTMSSERRSGPISAVGFKDLWPHVRDRALRFASSGRTFLSDRVMSRVPRLKPQGPVRSEGVAMRNESAGGIEKIPHYDEMIHRGDDLIEAYSSDVVMRGNPDAVCRVSDVATLREIVASCNRESIPVTFCGNRTSLTGSSVAESGLLVVTERMNRILDIDIRGDHATATAEPGIFLAEFQDQLMAQGLFYPPDPTSRKEACLGATVATNATGEDSLLYGSTRCHVRRLKVLLADGTERELIRPRDSRPGREKNLAGYYMGGDPIDLFIGSEGTLGLITEVTVDLIRNPADHFSAVAFFPSIESVLRCVVGLRAERSVVPRCLEIMDESCLGILRSHPDCFPIPENARAALYFKQEYRSEAEQSDFLDCWLRILEMRLQEDLAGDLLDAAFVAADGRKKDLLRDLRHHIPATINEQAGRFRDDGGGKVGTDWWVPLDHIEEAMALAIKDSEEIGLPIYVFGHIGNGHPHVNFLVRNAREKELAREAIIRQCRRAVLWGGSVSGEHGIGKIKRHLLAIQRTREEIERMMALKRQFDPRWILGRNNLFTAP